MRQLTAWIMAAAATAALVTACGNPSPPAGDVRACQFVRTELAQFPQDPLHYDMAAAIAATPQLKQAIGAIGGAEALIGSAYSSTGYDQENTAVNAVAAVCSQDGVKGVSRSLPHMPLLQTRYRHGGPWACHTRGRRPVREPA